MMIRSTDTPPATRGTVFPRFILIPMARPSRRPRRSTSRRSEEHTSELQSLMRISYAVFCLKKKQRNNNRRSNRQNPAEQSRKELQQYKHHERYKHKQTEA